MPSRLQGYKVAFGNTNCTFRSAHLVVHSSHGGEPDMANLVHR